MVSACGFDIVVYDPHENVADNPKIHDGSMTRLCERANAQTADHIVQPVDACLISCPNI